MAANTGDSMELVQNPVIFSNVKAHTCLDHLKKEEQQRYATKLQVLGTCDPYSAPTALFTPLKSTTSLPELNFGDVYIYLVENPSPYTAIKMKAYKSTDSYLYFRSGWVNNPVVWEVKDNTFFIVKAKCSVIENETRLQSKCAMWFDQRAGRVTASNIRTACQTDPDQPAVSLLKKLCYPVAYKHQTNNLPQSLKWGIQHEDMVVEEYNKVVENHHTNFTVRKGGLFINPQYPWLGASPDGILQCDCHEMGVLEVKAPSSLQNSTLIDKSRHDKSFCLQELEGKLSLKREHQYFYQVQAQIHISQASYCDFAVWGPGKGGNGELHIETILPDTDFFENICEKVHTFIKKCVIPELLAKVYIAPIPATSHATKQPSESKGCYCGVSVLHNEDRLECKSGICERKYIHKSCLKFDTTHLKVSSWKCSDCSRVIAKQKRDNRKQVTKLAL